MATLGDLLNPAIVGGIIAVLVVLAFLQSAWLKGVLGEARVNRALRTLDKADYRLFPNLILPVRGGTTQIDHIVASRFGVFVIETKNMRGWIFGSADRQQWTQVIYRWKSRFQNPIRQNYRHVRAVQEVLKLDRRKVHGVVVFVGRAEARSLMPDDVVWNVARLKSLILSKRTELLSDNELRDVCETLASDTLRATSSRRNEHVRHLKERDYVKPSRCPRCEANMVERINRQSGSRFLACTRYPACRGTRQLGEL